MKSSFLLQPLASPPSPLHQIPLVRPGPQSQPSAPARAAASGGALPLPQPGHSVAGEPEVREIAQGPKVKPAWGSWDLNPGPHLVQGEGRAGSETPSFPLGPSWRSQGGGIHLPANLRGIASRWGRRAQKRPASVRPTALSGPAPRLPALKTPSLSPAGLPGHCSFLASPTPLVSLTCHLAAPSTPGCRGGQRLLASWRRRPPATAPGSPGRSPHSGAPAHL